MIIQISNNYNCNFSGFKKYKRIPKSELLSCMKAGYTYKQMGDKYNVPTEVVARSMCWYGLKSLRTLEIEQNARDVIQLSNQGYSVKQIKEELALRSDLIKKIINRHKESQTVSDDQILIDITKKLNMSEEDIKKYLK